MRNQFDMTEEEQRAEIAYGMSRGNLFCGALAILDNLGRPRPVQRYVPWWRRYRFRLLIFAALAGMILSGSSLH